MGSSPLSYRWWIVAVLAVEAALMPWNAHAYDVAAFLSHAERVYFGHVPPAALWPFGSISLAALLFSQLPILVFPQLWGALPLRIFLLKLPAWLADVGTAAIVAASASQRSDAGVWALRYLIDPAVIFVTVLHGQNDALANVFAVGGIALTIGGRYEFAGLALGLGAGTKFYPAAFVPLLVAVAYRNGSLPRALRAFATFAVAAALTLLPVLLGRTGSVFAAYRNNSFGPQGNAISPASVWALLPHHAAVPALPAIEQLLAVAVPIVLAIAELRHVSGKGDIARAAMVSAVAIVLLNPGVHPPFYLWIAGPLVLYAAVTSDWFVSLAGLALSCAGTALQFCQEGSDEYFLLNFSAAPHLGALRCVAPPAALQTLALCSAALIVLAAYRRVPALASAAQSWRGVARTASAAVFVAFTAAIAVETASAATRSSGNGYAAEERAVNTFAIDPLVRAEGAGCRLTYPAEDIVVYAGNAFAARFATASLGYTLYSPANVIVRGRTVPLDRYPSQYENVDVRTVGQQTIRITREFDLSAALRPYRDVETFIELPCSLIANNPLLIYRFDIAAAQAAAAATPLSKRLAILARGDP